jgi:DNA polymerase-3 subunit gamma/tau
VVGQDAVVRTLRNAVTRGRVHHAYLFVGSRGTGKTSMAKILAACLNCERGPTVEPCGVCESCRAIAQARSLDVIEMDAASNNSVDDIRELRESVAFAPVSGRSKVYILDEAHMLSTAAWNAFLKTLEEPPADTVFVLATTEAQKVPATVVDRCHRFDFQRPTVEQIADVLRRAAAAESIAIPPEAVAALARAATGSFRDALGILEQLVTYSGSEIALEDVLAVLGATDVELLEETLDAVHAGDARAVLLAVARCADGGRDAGAFAADLEVRARELLLVATLGEVPAELALTPEADARLAAQAERVGAATAVRLLEQLAAALEAVKAGADPRTQLELALVKAARPAVDGSLSAVLARLERLERGGATGAAGGVEVGPPEAARVGGPSAVPAPVTGGPATRAAPPRAPETAVSAAPVTAPAAASSEPAEPSAAAPPPPPDPALPDPALAQDVAALWPAVLELVAAKNKLTRALLDHAQPLELRESELRVAFAASASFPKKKAEDREHRATVIEALRELTGDTRVSVSYELREDLAPAQAAGTETPRSEEEWVARFKAELDAEELPAEDAADGEPRASATTATARETATAPETATGGR